jgi:importin-9
MEPQVLELLRASQSPAAGPRMAAELQLKELYTNEYFPGALVTIGAHKDIATPDRLAALINLKNFVNVAWSASLDDYAGQVLVSDPNKTAIREKLLAIVAQGQDDSKILAQTAAVVSKIAKADFPEEWPGLLDQLLGFAASGTDDQIHGILVVLGEVIEDALDEDQFYRCANGLVAFLHSISTDARKRLMVRAHAIRVFALCFDFVENLKDRDEDSVRGFAKNIVDSWSSFFLNAVKEPMPGFPSLTQYREAEEGEVTRNWRGVVALKVQVIQVS